ncbi:MAG: hypothetical protein ACXWUP_06100 [Allosphingosinicella sp.]
MALFTLRLMDEWKSEVDDYDCAMIMVAVIVITSERLLRDELSADEARLDTVIDPARLRKCNIASIAEATGINRETARRKINDLIGRGLLVRLRDRSIALRPGLVQEEAAANSIRRKAGEIAAVANRLSEFGVLSGD